MAIDSRERSAAAVSAGCLFVLPPLPDGSIDAPDSAQLLRAYRGFFEAEQPPPEGGQRFATWRLGVGLGV